MYSSTKHYSLWYIYKKLLMKFCSDYDTNLLQNLKYVGRFFFCRKCNPELIFEKSQYQLFLFLIQKDQ